MTAQAKAKPPAHSVTTVHGNTRVTVTRQGGATTTTKTVRHGSHRVTTTTVRHGSKVVRSSRSVSLVTKAKPAGAKARTATGTKRGAPGRCAGGHWVTGGNDRLATCVPAALANSCLIATGYRIPDWQVVALAGERSIESVLAGLGVAYRAADGLSDGVILGVAGLHAVTVHDGAAVSWGAEASLDGLAVEEAWQVDWR